MKICKYKKIITPGKVFLLWHASTALSASSLDAHTTKQQPDNTNQIRSQHTSNHNNKLHIVWSVTN